MLLCRPYPIRSKPRARQALCYNETGFERQGMYVGTSRRTSGFSSLSCREYRLMLLEQRISGFLQVSRAPGMSTSTVAVLHTLHLEPCLLLSRSCSKIRHRCHQMKPCINTPHGTIETHSSNINYHFLLFFYTRLPPHHNSFVV